MRARVGNQAPVVILYVPTWHALPLTLSKLLQLSYHPKSGRSVLDYYGGKAMSKTVKDTGKECVKTCKI